MSEGKELDRLALMIFALMSVPPITPAEGEIGNSESRISFCQDCINREEGRCLSNGLTGRFPSGRCGNYETQSYYWDNYYNVTFGPVPEGSSMGTRIITTRPELEYKEIVLAAA